MHNLRIRTRAVAVPLEHVTRISTRTITARHYVIVDVEDADGAIGTGYTYAGTSGSRLVADAIDGVLAPVADETDDRSIRRLWDRLYQEALLIGRRGLVVRALSAVDIALWDLRARRAKMPLAALLGGSTDQTVPAYASGGYYVEDDQDPIDAVIREIHRNKEAGFHDHKIKVGGTSIAQDAERVAAAIDAIGGTGRLALDANNAYADVPEASRAGRAFESAAGGAGLWWFEEPLSPENIRGHAALSRILDTPIATGEIHQTRWEFRDLISTGSAQILQPDVGVLGGITEFLRVAGLASSCGIPIAPHWHANLHAQLAAALPNTLTVEYFDLAKDIYNFERLVTPDSRLHIEEGRITVSDRPGIGVTFDRDALDTFTTAA